MSKLIRRCFVSLALITAAPAFSAVIGVNFHPRSGQNPVEVQQAMTAAGLGHMRMDTGSQMVDGEIVPNQATMNAINTYTAAGTPITAVVYNSMAYSIQSGGACTQNLQEAENIGFRETFSQVEAYGGKVAQIELSNEVSLYKNIRNGGRAPYTDANLYNTDCGRTMAAILKGMNNAVHAVAQKQNVNIKTVLGAVSDGSTGFIKFALANGVNFDVLGFHAYPSNGQPVLATDPWFGSGGLLKELAQFGRPIDFNELNCGEIYSGGYDNRPGSMSTLACMASLDKNLNALMKSGANIGYIDLYEIADETFACAGHNAFTGLAQDAECRFGIMYDLKSPKQQMSVITKYTGMNNYTATFGIPNYIPDFVPSSVQGGPPNIDLPTLPTTFDAGFVLPPPGQRLTHGYRPNLNITIPNPSDDLGCQIMLCMAATISPWGIPACVPVMERMFDILSSWDDDLPSCLLASAPDITNIIRNSPACQNNQAVCDKLMTTQGQAAATNQGKTAMNCDANDRACLQAKQAQMDAADKYKTLQNTQPQ